MLIWVPNIPPIIILMVIIWLIIIVMGIPSIVIDPVSVLISRPNIIPKLVHLLISIFHVVVIWLYLFDWSRDLIEKIIFALIDCMHL